MQFFGLLSLLVTIAIVGWWFASMAPDQTSVPSSAPTEQSFETDPVLAAQIAAKTNIVRLAVPAINDTVASPLIISGEARGYWFFEASFPVLLTDWDGKIIAESYATATGDWMTEEFVSFAATVDFESPYHSGDPEFMRRGFLILKKDNPSGLSENDDSLEIPILFEAQSQTMYGESLDAAQAAADLLSR